MGHTGNFHCHGHVISILQGHGDKEQNEVRDSLNVSDDTKVTNHV